MHCMASVQEYFLSFCGLVPALVVTFGSLDSDII